MTVRMLISAHPGEARGALVRDGELVWYDFVRTLHEGGPPPPPGSVFLARVRKVEPGLQAAFVELGAGEAAMLPAKDARALARPGTDGKSPIERLVHEGEVILVQIVRAARNGKGPRVTADVSLPDPEGKPVRPRRGGESPVWRDLQERARAARPPALLWRPPEPDPAVALWRAAPAAPSEIETDHEPAATALRRAARNAGSPVEVTVSKADVLAAHGFDEEIAALSEPVAPLKSGGTLIIETTAALTAVDVNAGGALRSTEGDTALKVNLEAAHEIPRQIGLRRLGGVLVIDFLRLKAARPRKRVIATLNQRLETFGVNARAAGFSAAGLVELILPRTATPLRDRLSIPCPHCGGRGDVPDIEGRALALLKRIASEARQRGPGLLEARAAPEVIAWLDARPDAVTRELERFAVTSPRWRAEPGWPSERMDVRPFHEPRTGRQDKLAKK